MRTVLVAALFCLLTLAHPALAEHPAPAPVGAVTNNGVRFVVPNDNGLRAYVEAWDVQTGKKRWTKTIFRHYYIPPFGNECMHYEYLTTMTVQGGRLILTSDLGRNFSLDTRTRRVRRVRDLNLEYSTSNIEHPMARSGYSLGVGRSSSLPLERLSTSG